MTKILFKLFAYSTQNVHDAQGLATANVLYVYLYYPIILNRCTSKVV